MTRIIFILGFVLGLCGCGGGDPEEEEICVKPEQKIECSK
jgi:hypothetical protein